MFAFLGPELKTKKHKLILFQLQILLNRVQVLRICINPCVEDPALHFLNADKHLHINRISPSVVWLT